MESNKFKTHLENNIIPFWNKMKDEANGGFYGYADCNAVPDKTSVKGAILNNRILWFYSSAYILLQEPELLIMADHAYRFLTDYFYDNQYGGVYWSVNYDGAPYDDTKHTYNQAFAIYSLSAYYQASGKKDALDLAYEIYHTIEKKCKDANGYLEAFNRDFTPTSNEKLSENGVMAQRTMNTLLHVMEAYCELYRAGLSSQAANSKCEDSSNHPNNLSDMDSPSQVSDSIRYIFKLIREKIYDYDKQILDVFFDLDYNSLIDLESFGHNIEASWLIDRGCQILDDKALTSEMQPLITGLAKSAYNNAYDNLQHALNNEREGNKIDCQKIWWVQAEAVTGFYNAWQIEPQKIEYLKASEEIWQFIQQHVIDEKSGEWIESIPADNNVDPSQALAHPWKGPYHNGRMCIEMIQRLS
ncbi:MAG: AGE family epimerase/isomerase [Lachnospiraceae bacterium]|nr:AGE family epimerase/isomerase [Lachnospiraceae bacterium]